MLKQRSFQQKKEEVKRDWIVFDIKGKVLGRAATEIATLLIGKHKPAYSTHVDNGDYVVVINSNEVVVTGNKRTDKVYYTHSQFPGGFKEETFDKLQARKPKAIVENAVWGMLPKNKLRDPRMKRLKVFTGSTHDYEKHLANKSQESVVGTQE